MSKQQSKAPKERINITYKPNTGNADEGVELPLRMLMIGDYTLREEEEALEDRKTISVNKNNFNDVIREQKITLDMTVKNTTADDPEAEMSVELPINTIQDFRPENIAANLRLKTVDGSAGEGVLSNLLALRESLVALKNPINNQKSFGKQLQALISDEDQRKKLLEELGLSS